MASYTVQSPRWRSRRSRERHRAWVRVGQTVLYMTDLDLKLDEADQNKDGTTTLKERVSFQRRLWSSTPVKLRRIIVAVIGGTLIILGAALVVLPGPFTMPLVLAGLVVLSSEFAFAERLLVKSRAKLQSAMNAVRRKK